MNYLEKFKSGLGRWVFLILLGAAAPLIVSKTRGPQNSKERITTELEFVSCYDGDTCTATSREGFKLKLRFLGIDAPEMAPPGTRGKKKKITDAGVQPYAREARDYLIELVKGKTLKVELRGNDKYQRYLALIWTEKGELVNEKLIKEGFVYAYRHPKTDADIKTWNEKAESFARDNKKGFWSLPEAQRPQNPSEFRHGFKK